MFSFHLPIHKLRSW